MPTRATRLASSVALSDGNTLAVGAFHLKDGNATTINGDAVNKQCATGRCMFTQRHGVDAAGSM